MRQLREGAIAAATFLLVMTGCSSSTKWNDQDVSTFYGKCLSSAATQGIDNDRAGDLCSCELSAYQAHGYHLEDVQSKKAPASIVTDCLRKQGIG